MSRSFIAVMGLIAIGVAMIFRMSQGAYLGANGKSRETRMLSADLERALKSFEQEYGHLPEVGSLDLETTGPTGTKLLGILLGKERGDQEIQNPRSIAFLAVGRSRGRKAGLVYPDNDADKAPEKLCDSWGEPLRVILRRPGQPAPELSYGNKTVAIPLSSFAIVSKGPDRIEGTKDDLRSW